MRGRSDAELEGGEHARQVVSEQSRHIEPEAWEDLAAQDVLLVGQEQFKGVAPADIPLDVLILDKPKQILLHTIAAIGLQFGMTVDADAAGSDLGGQLGSAVDEAALKSGATATTWLDEQKSVGLWFVAHVQPQRAVVPYPHTRRKRPVMEQKTHEVSVRFAVVFKGDRRGHVNDSFDEFGLLHIGHRFVTPMKLIPVQSITLA
jgi:hypothetical protein